MGNTKKDIKSMDLEELKREMEAAGEKTFRAKQLYEWMHQKLARESLKKFKEKVQGRLFFLRAKSTAHTRIQSRRNEEIFI